MKKLSLIIMLFSMSLFSYGQTGHLMGGIGSVNTSMGGAATGQPLDISGAIQWNPASISAFDHNTLNVDMGLFFASPKLSSSIPANMMYAGSPEVKGTTEDQKGVSPLPSAAMLWANPDSKFTYAFSVFGVSGFGVDFPQETNLPVDASGNPNPQWDPSNSNPITYPQNMNGFGHIKSNYMLMQIGVTVAYQLTDQLSIGLAPTFNYAALELAPNPTTNPDMAKGYPVAAQTNTTGFGGQVGIFYDSKKGFKAGISCKTKQNLSPLKFKNTYLDDSSAPDNEFDMDFPAILSVGLGYSTETIDFAVDYRMVDYENTNGFSEKGWVIAKDGPMAGYPTGAVKGFGWKNMSIISAGIQYKGIDKLPIRIGYTYSTNPIDEELAFFSVSAPAVITSAFQLGLTYEASQKIKINAVYHHGSSGEATTGTLMSPVPTDFGGPWHAQNNPLGKIPGTTVSYEMTTDLIMVGMTYTFIK